MTARVVLAMIACAAALPASAGMFDDEEARRQIADVRRQVETQAKTLERIESQVTDKKALLELVNQIEALKGEIASLRGQLEIHFLPGYAPELNPDEFVWNHLKKQGVSKKPLRQGESLHARVQRDLEQIRRSPALVRSFFRAPSVSYATD